MIRLVLILAASLVAFVPALLAAAPNPIVFVTQPPWPYDFATANSTFANHRASMESVPRGGDLYIRYPDGSLKNLTKEAGFGVEGFQGALAIAVRDPSVHWNGKKILFSMIIGAPTRRYQVNHYVWQMYEVSNLESVDTPVVTKVPNQPEAFNNVSPVYGTDEKIIFISDRPRDAALHLYPQRDEYESAESNTGLWSLLPSSGELQHLDHAPSGDFQPSIDSFGRLVFTRWDHLQRDQQNRCSNPGFQAFNFADESTSAAALDTDSEVFPEPRGTCEDDPDDHLETHSFNHFLPWQMNEDGTEMETLNHIGRHELVEYIGRSFTNDPNVIEYYGQYPRTNQYPIESLFQITEDPLQAGSYYGVQAPEFHTHAAGQIVHLLAPPAISADRISVTYDTHPETANTSLSPSQNHIGFSRDPLPLVDHTLIASHTYSTLPDENIGTPAHPKSHYAFRLRFFEQTGDYFHPTDLLTPGIFKTLSFWSPDVLVSFDHAELWELQAREVRARAKPKARVSTLPAIEQEVFDEEEVAVEAFQAFLRDNTLALIVGRNVTTRDSLDRQQPTNLKVYGSATQTVPYPGKVYTIAHLQLFQGDLTRAYAGGNSTLGRRVLATTMHGIDSNMENTTGPAGSVRIAEDGSFAAFVPANRPITYQLTNQQGIGVVRERVWLTFQPGEVRVCASCHGVNAIDQAGNPAPTNPPLALHQLLQYFKAGMSRNPKLAILAPGRVRAHQKFTLRIQRADHPNLSLFLRVGSRSCGKVLDVPVDAESLFERTLRGPSVKRTVRLRFSLWQGEDSVSQKRILLRKSRNVANARRLRSACRLIRRSLARQ